jgi:CheY-like chemotaxis protein
MALRVLLADESSTIKKVFQLALQDFAVEVRPVNVGVDVAPVARSFNPDIIFADVLLQKRSGYDVAAEIKQDDALKKIPVVLMWSGFMELDEDKFQACMANAQLEKPFDVQALRKLVADLVPRTKEQRLSQFLNFPKMPDIEAPKTAAPAGEKPPAPSAKAPPPPVPGGEVEDFAQVPLPKVKGTGNPSNPTADKYRVNLKPEELEAGHIPVEYELPSEKVSLEDMLKGDDNEVEAFSIKETRKSAAKAPPVPDLEVEADDLVPDIDEDTAVTATIGHVPGPAAAAGTAPALSAEQLEKIIREQSAEVIESVVWKVVPDLAAQIIERELNKLLKEREQSY